MTKKSVSQSKLPKVLKCAKIIFSSSIKSQMRYTELYEDGDFKSFIAVE